jgi:uncharacterized membrane protein SirB2
VEASSFLDRKLLSLQDRAAAREACMQGTHAPMSIGDLLFALAQWLKTTPLVEFSLWISKQPLSVLFDKTVWVIPVAQSIHILAIATAFSAVLMINLRIFGLAGESRTLEQTAERFLPWIKWALVTLLATGVVMIIGEPIRELLNPAFWTKMVLIVAAIAVNFWFQGSVRRNAALWTATPRLSLAVRGGAAGVVALWCVIMVLGRWIAYVPV